MALREIQVGDLYKDSLGRNTYKVLSISPENKILKVRSLKEGIEGFFGWFEAFGRYVFKGTLFGKNIVLDTDTLIDSSPEFLKESDAGTWKLQEGSLKVTYKVYGVTIFDEWEETRELSKEDTKELFQAMKGYFE